LGTGLFAFFLLFYQNQCYARFYALYGHCVGLGGGLMEWTSLIKQHMPDDPDVHWNCTRFMLAAMNVEYYSLCGPGIDEDEWKLIKERNLLTPDECEKVKAYTGFKPFLPVYWALKECRKQLWDEPGETTQSHVLKMQMLEDKALKFRGHTSQIINQLKQPVPWPYFHTLNLILFFTLVTMSYALVACGHIGLTFILLSVYMIAVLGIKATAVQLSDPFGDDAVDFELESFMKGAMTNAIAKLSDNHKCWARELPVGMVNPLVGTAYVKPHVHSRKSTGGGPEEFLTSMLSFGRGGARSSKPFVEISPGQLTGDKKISNEQLLNSQL